MQWPTAENPAIAYIGPTGIAESFGIVWRNFEALENRGGYSGPYDTAEAAEASARAWCDHYDLPAEALKVVAVDNVNTGALAHMADRAGVTRKED